MPDAPVRDSPRRSPEPPVLPVRSRRAFAWAFGVCVAFPVASAVLLTLSGGEMETATTLYGIYAFALSPVVWGLMLVAGIVARVQGHRAEGGEILLGVLAGAVVGALLFVGAGMLEQLR